jgi:hypothetical protein
MFRHNEVSRYFTIYHIPSEEISRAYCLAQRASGHYVGKKKKIIEADATCG